MDRITPKDGKPYYEFKRIVSLSDMKKVDETCVQFPPDNTDPSHDIDECTKACGSARRASVGNCLICARKCNLKGDEAIDKFCQKPPTTETTETTEP